MKVHEKMRRKGVTLVEICIGVVILSLVMTGVMRMFAGGIRGSQQGMAHLTNMQTAAIIIAQVEYDLMRATELNDPPVNTTETAARWKIKSEDGSSSTVIYNLLPDGLERQENNSTSGDKKHVFGKGLNLKLQFRHLEFVITGEKKKKEGMLIDLKVASDKNSNEEFHIRRMVVAKNLNCTQP